MKLLYTITSYPPAVGGAQFYFHHLAQASAKEHEVQVITHWDTNRFDWLLGTTLRAPATPQSYSMDGVSVYRMGFSLNERLNTSLEVMMYPFIQKWSVQKLAAKIYEQISQIAPDVDLVHNNRIGREFISVASLKLARNCGVPFVFTPNHHPRWVGWRYRVYNDLYREADALIALTPSEKDVFIGLGVDPERVHVVGAPGFLSPNPNGQTFRDKNHIEGPIVLFVGQKYEYKGFDLILKSTDYVWNHYPDVNFVFIGPRTSYSRKIFSKYKDRRIIELGSVTLDDKSNAIAASDIFCMPSAQESFGHVFVEAWTLGRPVIAADIPSERDLISDGIDGFVTPRTIDALVDKICTLLADRKLREKMGREGQLKVQREYSMDRIVEKTFNVYDWALNNVRHRYATSMRSSSSANAMRRSSSS